MERRTGRETSLRTISWSFSSASLTVRDSRVSSKAESSMTTKLPEHEVRRISAGSTMSVSTLARATRAYIARWRAWTAACRRVAKSAGERRCRSGPRCRMTSRHRCGCWRGKDKVSIAPPPAPRRGAARHRWPVGNDGRGEAGPKFGPCAQQNLPLVFGWVGLHTVCAICGGVVGEDE